MHRASKFFTAPILVCATVIAVCAQEPQQTLPAQQPQTPTPAPQTPAPADQTTAPKPSALTPSHHLSVGLRGRYFPIRSLSTMDSQTLLTTTTPVVTRDWNFTTSSHSPLWGVGPSVEYAINDHLTFTVDVYYNKLNYTKVTSIAWGTDDPSTTTDERTHMFRNETTKANLFDVPVMVHYKGVRSSGPFSRVFVGAGVTARTVASIKTTLLTTFPDTSTATTNDAATPSKRNVLGGVVGLGFRVVDDFNIHWTPEVRFTRWAASTFSTDSTVSPRNQFEINLGITF